MTGDGGEWVPSDDLPWISKTHAEARPSPLRRVGFGVEVLVVARRRTGARRDPEWDASERVGGPFGSARRVEDEVAAEDRAELLDRSEDARLSRAEQLGAVERDRP